MKKKISQSTTNTLDYLFGHPVRKLFTTTSLFLMTAVTYCGICVVSELDTSEGGFMGALVTILLAPEYKAMAVAAGNGGYVYYTMKGSDWQAVRIAPSTVNFRTAVYTGRNYVVAGGVASTSCDIYYSSNGVDWRRASVSGPCQDVVNDLASNGSEIVGVGGIITFASFPIELTSWDDGATWSRASVTALSAELTRIAFDGTYYLAATGVTSAAMFRKVPGGTFAAAPANPLAGAKICTLGDLYRIPGTGRVIAAGSRCIFPPPPAGSDYTINSSVSWTQNTAAIFGANTSQYPRALTYGNGRLVAVGDACRVDNSDDATATSLNWNYPTGTMNGCPATVTWRAVAWDGGRFIAAGEMGGATPVGIVAFSPTGNPNNWSFQTSGTPPLYAIAAK